MISSDLYELFLATSEGRLADIEVKFHNRHVLTVVLASEGYPAKSMTGRVISGLENKVENCIIHHAGTKYDGLGNLLSNGGRVLAIMEFLIHFMVHL